MNKTRDIEFAIDTVLANGPLSLMAMEEELYEGYPDLRGQDPRWIGVAMSHLDRDGKIEWLTCSSEHNHNDACTVQRAERVS